MIARRSIVLFSGAMLVLAATNARAETFLTDIEDVPVMAGLREIPDAAVVFDKPEGKIVETIARGSPTAAAVARFYEAALPPLGWTQITAQRERGKSIRRVFERENERLTVEIIATSTGSDVRFSLAPR